MYLLTFTIVKCEKIESINGVKFRIIIINNVNSDIYSFVVPWNNWFTQAVLIYCMYYVEVSEHKLLLLYLTMFL